jgi:hypothetical protein
MLAVGDDKDFGVAIIFVINTYPTLIRIFVITVRIARSLA